MLEYSDKDFIAAIRKCFKGCCKYAGNKWGEKGKVSAKKKKTQKRYREQQNGNFRTEKHKMKQKCNKWAQQQNGKVSILEHKIEITQSK